MLRAKAKKYDALREIFRKGGDDDDDEDEDED